MEIIKKTGIFLGIALVIVTILQIFNIWERTSFFDKVFFSSLIYMLIGGVLFIDAFDIFTFQRYAFHRLGRAIPFFSRLFMNGNSRDAELEDKPPAKDYIDYKERFVREKDVKDSYPFLLAFLILTIIAIIGIFV